MRDSFISTSATTGSFPLVAGGRATPIVVSAGDYAGVVRVAGDLAADIARVTGVEPAVHTGGWPEGDEVVIVGTIGRSPLIDDLVLRGVLDATGIAGAWETSLQQVVDDPAPGFRRAFVIAGSDQRGTIYGVYEASKQMGVSPWYWWDDVPVPHASELWVRPGRYSQGTPAVRYRGFFINDENPNLGTWGPRHFGPGLAPGYPWGFNHHFYSRVFEVLLRLKGNYLWPAVWGRAFAEDDPENQATATAYGVVIGTSHEAPMMRGIEEWNRHVRHFAGSGGRDPYGGNGEWSFRRNEAAIKAYWRAGIQRMVEENSECVVALGMRGNGDTQLSDGDGIDLMEAIIASQRDIIAEVTGQPVTTIPQVFALYKEVQRYWDRGLRLPEDVTIMFADDNWGNVRKLPDPSRPPRLGGYGIYYHFDYVGGGRSYKWVDTTNLANTWEQLNTVYAYGVDRIWMVNVGDLKGTELPLQFFLDFAWDPARLPLPALGDWERAFAEQNFGPEPAAEIAAVLHEYGRLQARRKPELLNRQISVDPTKDLRTDPAAVRYDDQATPFSLTDYAELERVTRAWQDLAQRSGAILRQLPETHHDAYFELAGYAIKATANLYLLRKAQFLNLHYAQQGRAATNDLADYAQARLADDFALAEHYNTAIANGKWRDFQLQPHIGYGDVDRYGPDAYWQQPELNNVALRDEIFPPVRRIDLPPGPELGVAIDGSPHWWPGHQSPPVLPTFSPYQTQPQQYIEIFNRGAVPFEYEISSGEPWLLVEPAGGTIEKQVRATVTVDWAKAPQGTTVVPVTVRGPGPGGSVEVVVTAVVTNPPLPQARGFVEANGYISIEADHFSRAVDGAASQWLRIPDIGRAGSGMTIVPVTAPRQFPGPLASRLEYDITLINAGSLTVWAYVLPRNNVRYEDGLCYAVSVDDAPPKVVDIISATGSDDTEMNRQWARNTSDNVNRTATTFEVAEPGVHVIKFWAVDPTVVLQNLIIDTGGLRESYLGPPESFRVRAP